jgi:flagellar export protein FliJ
MSRFKFRLQRVLELREEAERARAIALNAAQSEAAAAHAARDAIVDAQTAGQQTLSQASNSGSTVGTLQQMQYVLTALDSRLQIADSGVITADSLVRRAQDELRGAFQARHALQTLREKQGHEHQTMSRSAEQFEMNEIALTRFLNTDSSSTDSERSTHG